MNQIKSPTETKIVERAQTTNIRELNNDDGIVKHIAQTSAKVEDEQIGAMDDANIVNINDNNEDQQQADDEEEQQHQFAAAAAAANNRRHLEISSVLERKEKFPLRNRDKIDVLIKEFLEKLGDDVHDMLCDNDATDEQYRGLDSERDTEAEVETAISFFPEALTRTKELEGVGNLYPIQFLSCTCNEDGIWGCNVKAVTFIPIVARLAIEFELFEEVEERGGLLCQEDINGNNMLNVLQNLMLSDQIERDNREYHEPIDNKYSQVLIQLRKMGLFKKEDIREYQLLQILCSRSYFADKRFRFLVEWDPNALTQTDEDGCLPLLYAANDSSIRGFQLVFEYGISYHPKKIGISLLFKKEVDEWTPFQFACEKFGYEKVMEAVEDTLIRFYSSSDDTSSLNVADALLLAAIDENVHLDCVYFLLRRQPDVLQKLLSPLPYKSKLRNRKRKL